MFDSLQYNSTKCALQCELDSFFTMATYWVPDLPHNKSFSCHLAFRFDICWQHFICMIQAYKYASSRLWPYLTFFKLKITSILKSKGWGLETSELARKRDFLYSHRCVSRRTITLPSFNVLHCKLAKIALFVCTWARDYQGERVNPPYRSSN